MSSSISAPTIANQRNTAHRRIQSQQVAPGAFPAGFNPPAPVTGFGSGMGLDQASAPRGHGRRHSVNVLNKGHGAQPSQFFSYNGVEGFDDGFQPPQNSTAAANSAHSRAPSKADSSWRISKLHS